jgi:hypothetical protein
VSASVRPPRGVHFTSQVIDLARLLRRRFSHFRPARTAHGWETPIQGDGRGFSDLVLVRVCVILAELKSRTGRVSADQQAWLEAGQTAGAEAYVSRPADLTTIADVLR